MIVKVFEDVEDVEDGKCLNEKEFTEFEFNSGRVDGVRLTMTLPLTPTATAS